MTAAHISNVALTGHFGAGDIGCCYPGLRVCFAAALPGLLAIFPPSEDDFVIALYKSRELDGKE